ncbi:hypothetical protein LTR56_013539 [Elasticomyces elasticus]|nr:hypothetical protein LTR56_013539 [Elasticomyces elasticus]KAK3651002.1 hypothetical protein LTR22_012250 [Elasticomyces elasticus]KAK4931081.1 hypothetical protein LTR49_002497 [Elasticomyces elasticus]KAK5765548.1 hypothetical protein LTS12_004300 [Elasticomyces elasticus]
MASELAVEKGKASVEHYEVAANDGRPAVMGTMHLNTEELLLVPAPSSDPRDPLNLPRWRKILFVVLLSAFSSLGLSLVSGMGGLLGFYIPIYAPQGATYADITALMTYPTMMMGVGNLICMPLALAVGRRFIYLMSLVTMILGGLLAAYSQSYGWHLGARMVLGIAAGNSEALVPMMIQEIHFIHERSTYLMWQAAMQLSITAVYCLFASPIAGAIGPGNWYILGVGLGAGVLLLSIVWVPETRYTRALAAYGQEVETETPDDGKPKEEPKPMRVSERPALDFVTYPARTLRSDLRLFVGKPDWSEGLYALRNTFQVLLFPNVFWAFCLNGLTLGVNIALGTTYGTVLSSPPYNWSQNSVSYINAGQIVVSVIALPLLGNGSDWLIRWRARRNDGVHEPEVRLIPLVLPIIIGVASAVLYGQAAAHPERFHWFAIVFAYAGYLFAFLGANIVGITLLLDSYPARAGPVLVVICAFRGFVSFGTSYGVAAFIEHAGYDGAFGAYAGLTGLLGLIGIPM